MTTFTRTDRGPIESYAPARRRLAIASWLPTLRVIAAGAAVALVGAAWPLPVAATLVLGVAVVLYAIASMATESPDERG